jgi:hypothetical protein
MKIQESNKLIAIFLGYKLYKTEKGFYGIVYPDCTDWSFGCWEVELLNEKIQNDFNYHEDWNKLIKVVEKIESFENVLVKMVGSKTIIAHESKTIAVCETISRINSTYRCVLEFIKYYNYTNPLP